MLVARPLVLVALLVPAVTMHTAASVAVSGEREGNDEAPTAADQRRLTFEEDVVPLLQARCFKCHGDKLRKSGLDLRRRFSLLEGGEGGPAIVPGQPDESPLIEMVEQRLMPPEGNKPLDPRQIAVLRRWVAAGPPIKAAEEPPLETGDDVQVTDADRDFWSFRPPVRPAVPTVAAGDRVRAPIDAFLLSKLEAAGASFNPDAPRHVLVRRLYFDLIGLPPAPEEIDRFVSDSRPAAYERLVDRLLASTRHGERWARHWLDVAGYADSDGYLDADRLRPEAWRYRDYVIRAINDDKPYDRFVLEQVAGDELFDWRRAPELSNEMTDALVATGFLRTAADPTYDKYAEKTECHKVLADTIEIMSSAFLGLTVKCARCHAHKFDPIPLRDYYRLHTVLSSAYDPEEWIVSAMRNIPLATEAQLSQINKTNEQIDAEIQQLNAELDELTGRFRSRLVEDVLAQVRAEHGASADRATLDNLQAALLADPKKRNETQKQAVAKFAADTQTGQESLAAKFPEYKRDLDRLKSSIQSKQSQKEQVVQIRGLLDLDDAPREQHVLLRGDHSNPGETVEPGVLAPAGHAMDIQPGYQTTGRRLALARWLVDSEHPTAARVYVNRVWHQHFGRGIVETLDNFGKTGARPTHPELLDWLATELIESGWSSKHLHRLIVTSTAYRQSSQPNLTAQAADPLGVLLGSWPARRHEGEVIRDCVLAVAGKLNDRMFGKPIPVERDQQGMVSVADNMASNRRSIYLIVRRSQPVTMLELFDTPRMEVNCIRRNRSIVVTQSLATLHSRFFETSAAALAARLLNDVPENRVARLDRAFQLCIGRSPSETEQQSIFEFLDTVGQVALQEANDETSNNTANTGNSAATAETTGEQQNAARKEAWTQLSLVLLNSNEFLFVQ